MKVSNKQQEPLAPYPVPLIREGAIRRKFPRRILPVRLLPKERHACDQATD